MKEIKRRKLQPAERLKTYRRMLKYYAEGGHGGMCLVLREVEPRFSRAELQNYPEIWKHRPKSTARRTFWWKPENSQKRAEVLQMAIQELAARKSSLSTGGSSEREACDSPTAPNTDKTKLVFVFEDVLNSDVQLKIRATSLPEAYEILALVVKYPSDFKISTQYKVKPTALGVP
jgi:hypothetical protein